MMDKATVRSNLLGECVACGKHALAYTGATLTDDGKYLCASCTAARKAPPGKKPPVHQGHTSRRDYPEPPPVMAACWLQLGDGRFALVDAADFRRVNTKRWFFFGGHAVRREQWGGKLRHDYLQRFVLGLDKRTHAIEFIDNDPLNCRKENLRLAPKNPA